MVKICQILLVGTDITKFDRGIVELGANKIVVITPNRDKYYAITRKIIKKYDIVADTYSVPVMDNDSFNFTQEFKRIIAENFRDFEIKINASTDVRNWKLLAYFSIQQFLPYLREYSDNRIMFYEVVGGDAIPLSEMKYQKEMSDEEMREAEDLDEDEIVEDLDAATTNIKDVIQEEPDAYFDDVWGSPNKRPLPRMEIYPIETLTNTEQHIVDIISRQEVTMDLIQAEYSIITDKMVTPGLLSRYLGYLKSKAIVIEADRDGRNKLFKLTDYGLKYVLPIVKPNKK